MKIEKPDWWSEAHAHLAPKIQINEWFRENVEPINSMLEQGVEVTGLKNIYDTWFFTEPGAQHPSTTPHTHKALLINIQEIKPKTKEERALELLKTIDATYSDYNKFDVVAEILVKIEEAKAILEGE